MSLLRSLIKTPPILDDDAVARALMDLAKEARRRGEPIGVFVGLIRREFRALHKTGWKNPDLAALQKRAEAVYRSLPVDEDAARRWTEMYEGTRLAAGLPPSRIRGQRKP